MRLFEIQSAVIVGLVFLAAPTFAANPDAATYITLLKSGKVPAENVGLVLDAICNQGDADDLRVVYEKTLDAKGLPAEARTKALGGLADAVENRKLKPSGDLASITAIVAENGATEVQLAAVRLASLWQVSAAGKEFQRLAADPKSKDLLRGAALTALVKLGGKESRGAIEKLTEKGVPSSTRIQAVAALVTIDAAAAAPRAAQALADAAAGDSPAPIVEAFLAAKQGQEKLAAALKEHPPGKDMALLGLRAMYGYGRSDEPLSGVLSKIADIPVETAKPTPELITQIGNEATKNGDPARGEAIFRRADLGCMKCHSLVGAGGQVGPELSPVGAASPVEYIVQSVLDPNASIKEQFRTKKVETVSGLVVTGIVLESNERQVKLKDATAKEIVIPRSEVESETEGRTLMPDGLTKFLTHQELLDLVRFVCELGKPGPFGPRKVPSIQRWRVVRTLPADLAGEMADAEKLRTFIQEDHPEAWTAAYSRVDGKLPLCEIVPKPGAKTAVLLQGEFDVTEQGPIGFRIQGPAGTTSWLDGSPNDDKTEFSPDTPLEAGKHKLTLRVPCTGDAKETVLLEILASEGSSAHFTIVGGS